MLEGVNVTLDEQKIGTALHGQEATTGDVDTMSCSLGVSCDYGGGGKVRTFEVFNRCSGGCLQLRIGYQGWAAVDDKINLAPE